MSSHFHRGMVLGLQPQRGQHLLQLGWQDISVPSRVGKWEQLYITDSFSGVTGEELGVTDTGESWIDPVDMGLLQYSNGVAIGAPTGANYYGAALVAEGDFTKGSISMDATAGTGFLVRIHVWYSDLYNKFCMVLLNNYLGIEGRAPGDYSVDVPLTLPISYSVGDSHRWTVTLNSGLLSVFMEEEFCGSFQWGGQDISKDTPTIECQKPLVGTVGHFDNFELLQVVGLVRTTTPALIGEYVWDQLESKYGAGCVERISTYNGTGAEFLTLTAITPRTHKGNFALMYQEPDGGPLEVVGIRIKTTIPGMILDWTGWR